MKIISITGGDPFPQVWTDDFISALGERGSFTLVPRGAELSTDDVLNQLRANEIAIVGWDALGLPTGLAEYAGSLRYICSYSGTIRFTVPREIVAAGIAVSNWGAHPAPGVAEAAMTHLLVALHQIPAHIDTMRSGGWGIGPGRNGMLLDLAVGIYGFGVIGRRFVDMLRPFGARVMVHDPYVDDMPDDVARVHSLDELCDFAEALVVHAGLSDETKGSVTAEHLARLPDGAVVVNTARAEIIDELALFAEVESGRLRAGVDVVSGESLDPDHPIRQSPGFAMTYHQLDTIEWPQRPGLSRMQQRVIDQIDRYARGEQPEYLFDLDRYDRST